MEKSKTKNDDDIFRKNISDIPDKQTILVPTYEPSGPFGAKSVAEININEPLPTIFNAIYDAVCIRIKQTPLTPEKI